MSTVYYLSINFRETKLRWILYNFYCHSGIPHIEIYYQYAKRKKEKRKNAWRSNVMKSWVLSLFGLTSNMDSSLPVYKMCKTFTISEMQFPELQIEQRIIPCLIALRITGSISTAFEKRSKNSINYTFVSFYSFQNYGFQEHSIAKGF